MAPIFQFSVHTWMSTVWSSVAQFVFPVHVGQFSDREHCEPVLQPSESSQALSVANGGQVYGRQAYPVRQPKNQTRSYLVRLASRRLLLGAWAHGRMGAWKHVVPYSGGTR